MRISLRLLQKQKEHRMAAPAKAYFFNLGSYSHGSINSERQRGTWMDTFSKESNTFNKTHEILMITLDQLSIAKKSACGRYGVSAFLVLTRV